MTITFHEIMADQQVATTSQGPLLTAVAATQELQHLSRLDEHRIKRGRLPSLRPPGLAAGNGAAMYAPQTLLEYTMVLGDERVAVDGDDEASPAQRLRCTTIIMSPGSPLGGSLLVLAPR